MGRAYSAPYLSLYLAPAHAGPRTFLDADASLLAVPPALVYRIIASTQRRRYWDKLTWLLVLDSCASNCPMTLAPRESVVDGLCNL